MSRPRFYITIAIAVFFLGVFGNFYEFYKWMLTAPLHMWKAHFFIVLVYYLLSLILAVVIVWKPQRLNFMIQIRQRLSWLRWIIFVGSAILISWFFVYASWSEIFNGYFARLQLLLLTISFMAWLASSGNHLINWRAVLAALVLLCASFAVAISFQQVLDYPFPLYWSEGNRFWDYSVLYGRHLYIFPVDKSISAYIDRGRQSLWGLPFLFMAQPSIWFVRFWSALMYTLPYAVLGWFVFKPQRGWRGDWLLCGLWAFLFLYQGPIYTPLVLAAILIAASRQMRLLPAIFLVGLAGYYSRTCRITWTFAPAMWAGMVTLLDTASHLATTTAQRWKRAIALSLAGLSGFVLLDLWPPLLARIQGTIAKASIVSIEGIQSASGRQPLLWDRLLPNTTYPPGIILGLLTAILPLVILLVFFWRSKKWTLGIWQKLVIAGSLSAFLIVGIIVSVKIGGGSNLHNLDMFLLTLLFIGSLAWDYGGYDWLLEIKTRLPVWLKGVAILAITLPIGYQMMTVRTFRLPTQELTDETLSYVEQYVAALKDYGDILFIDQRQLLTFGYIKDIPLVADYEKKRMMDEAMAENGEYFKPFYRDLANYRFSLIISEPLVIHYQGNEYEFGNENDAWVKWVSIPIQCYYEIEKTFPEAGLQLLMPRETPFNNPNVKCPES